MSTRYKAPIFDNSRDPEIKRNPDSLKIYYGKQLEPSRYTLKRHNLRRYVFVYSTATRNYEYFSHSKGIRYTNIKSVLDTQSLNAYNNYFFEKPMFEFNKQTNDLLVIESTQEFSSLMAQSLRNLISSPSANKYYFLEGLNCKWIKNPKLNAPITAPKRSLFRIYRYGTLTTENIDSITNTAFEYETVKSISLEDGKPQRSLVKKIN
jgi:hypothetical protein